MTIDVLGSGTLRVVIVDDTADLRELLRHALVRGGMAVVGEAGDGAAGIEVVRSTQPDVVLLDLSMPVMDGLEALPKIRALAPQTRVIVLSGFEATQMAERALAIGADGYLQKGASLGRILDQIRDIVGDRPGPPATPGEVEVVAPVVLAPVDAPAHDVTTAQAPPLWDAVSLAPFAILEIGADPPYRLVSINAAGRSLLCVDPLPSEPLADVAPEIAAAISNSRLTGDGEFEANVQDRPVRVTLRHTATSLLIYLHEITDEIGHLRSAIATTAHEIRGPVAVLCAITETILEEELETRHVERLMTAIGRQSRLLDSITGDLLVAAQVQRGTLRIDSRTFDPIPVVTAVMEDHGLTHEALDVEDRRQVHADPLRLQQMLGNLISNARKYGEPPIRIRIRSGSEVSRQVCIDVEDRGPGVPPDFQPQLFREFSRAGGTVAAGSGLGLNVVQTLAQAQGGSVSYQPRVGTGAVFTLSLPAAGG
ncbi:MAG: response regulator [Propionibacteriales bacterium]|nr:response regulator [Propionibacteriales bacterium]